MESAKTTVAVQRALDRLRGDAAPETVSPLVRDLLAESAERLHLLCATMLHRSYSRLTRPPLNLQSEEMLSAVVERLIKALRELRPENPRQFFALANQHVRWELNEMARRLDERTAWLEMKESAVAAAETSHTGLSAEGRRILEAIGALPDEEREVFELVRVQGLTHSEVAEMLEVATKTVQRRLNRSLLLLAEALGNLRLPGVRPSNE